ncbi:DUF397 domain-containing protein [Streptomyces sp. T-3]|nr:DUF397 domain-containing protein [Streptomyces sp. T-3]
MNTALEWFKSSYSTEQGGDCVEVASDPTVIHIRDSKLPDGATLTVPPTAWAAFLTHATR